MSTWPLFGMAVIPPALLIVGRQLRALECLVHEASHGNWWRSRRWANDILATVLAVVPTGARLSAYRASHLQHHGRFGTLDDPDLQRYSELDLEGLDHVGALRFTGGLLRRFGPYQRGWAASLGSAPLTILIPASWAIAVVAVPASLLVSQECGEFALAVWATGYLVVLPVIRFIGESSEHVYSQADTVFDATVSNIGLLQRALLPPHGDGYHTLHHMWPGVPHHRIARLHRALLGADPVYAERLLVRTRAGQHDPPLHHLAQQPRLRPTTPPDHRPGKRCLKRH